MKAPRSVVRELEHGARLPRGSAERFLGYAVLGVRFSSGHLLAMRRFVASSVGPAYSSVWHRTPDGTWSMWVDVEPLHGCPRYFGSELRRVVRVPIDISWPHEDRMIVRIDGGRELEWELLLASTLSTRFLSAVGGATPGVLWRRRFVLAAMGAVAGPIVRAGRLSLHGRAPNGQWFMANPKALWVVSGARVRLRGDALGEYGSLPAPVSLGDFTIPRRGLFAVGHGLFEPFVEGVHLAVASREGHPLH